MSSLLSSTTAISLCSLNEHFVCSGYQLKIESRNKRDAFFQTRRQLHGRRVERDDPGGRHRRRWPSLFRGVLQHDDRQLNELSAAVGTDSTKTCKLLISITIISLNQHFLWLGQQVKSSSKEHTHTSWSRGCGFESCRYAALFFSFYPLSNVFFNRSLVKMQHYLYSLNIVSSFVAWGKKA